MLTTRCYVHFWTHTVIIYFIIIITIYNHIHITSYVLY